MIRAATKFDFPFVSKYTQGLIKESAFGKYFEGYHLTEEMLNQYIDNPAEKFCIMIEDDSDNTTVGFVMFDLLKWPYIDKEVKFSRISFVYIEERSRGKGLMKDALSAFEYWSEKVGADYCTTNYKAKGYKKVETVYMKEIKCLK